MVGVGVGSCKIVFLLALTTVFTNSDTFAVRCIQKAQRHRQMGRRHLALTVNMK